MELYMHLCLTEKDSRLLLWYLCCTHSLCNWDYRYAARFELKSPQESGDFCFQKQGQTIKDILRSNGFLPYCMFRKWLGASMVLWICPNLTSKKLSSSLVFSILNIPFFFFRPQRGKKKPNHITRSFTFLLVWCGVFFPVFLMILISAVICVCQDYVTWLSAV